MKALVWGDFPLKLLESIVVLLREFASEVWINIASDEKSISVKSISCDRIIRDNFENFGFCDEMSFADKQDLLVIVDGWSLCLSKKSKLNYDELLKFFDGLKHAVVIMPKVWTSHQVGPKLSTSDARLWGEFQRKASVLLEAALNSGAQIGVIETPPKYSELTRALGCEGFSPKKRFGLSWLAKDLLEENLSLLSDASLLAALRDKLSSMDDNEKWFTRVKKDVEHYAIKPKNEDFLALLNSGQAGKILIRPCTIKNFIKLTNANETPVLDRVDTAKCLLMSAWLEASAN